MGSKVCMRPATGQLGRVYIEGGNALLRAQTASRVEEPDCCPFTLPYCFQLGVILFIFRLIPLFPSLSSPFDLPFIDLPFSSCRII